MPSRRCLAALATALAGLASSAPAGAEEPALSRTVESQGPVKVGDPAPSFGGFNLEGRMVSLRELLAPPRGEASGAVVISFFATWCKPCKEHIPAIARVAQELRQKNVRVVLVAHGQNADEVRPWLAGAGFQLPVLLDPFAKISGRFGVDKALPRTFVLDGKGNIRTIYVLEGADFEQSLKSSVTAALK